MLRIRLQLPKGAALQVYSHQDLIHDALVNAWVEAGATSADIIGYQAKPWNFAALGWHRGHNGFAHSLIVSTPDAGLARVLSRLKPEHIVKRRWETESVNFSAASVHIQPDPILPQQTQLGCIFYSPLVLRDETHPGKNKHWHQKLDAPELCLSETINRKLSFMAGREVKLALHPDSLYLRATPKHSVLVNLKIFQDGRKSFVIGMQAPMLLQGSEDDLRLAWYAGIGEKTRSGFGCLGLAEEGVGR